MTDREKLIALMRQVDACICNLCDGGEERFNHSAGILADHLLANGVVVREWIPVAERLPEADDVCLCFDRRMISVLQWDKRAERWVDYRRSYPKSAVTHWMPLPEPPKEGE